MENKKCDLTEIIEGQTSILLYKNNHSEKGPGKKQGLPFYNASMEMNRDISISVLQYLVDKSKNEINVFDGLASSGIRGFRFLNEVNGSFNVNINDWSEEAYFLIQKNKENFNSEKIQTFNKNIHSILSEKSFDYIDIDPFGSPATFFDSALRSIKHNGIIALTATDTATLCGVYPKVCRRRYNSNPAHGPCMHETGLRILIGHIGRQAGKYEKGIIPLLSYSTDHYMRAYLTIKNGVRYANDTINQINQVSTNLIPGHEKNDEKIVGPLWMGNIHNKNCLPKIRTITAKKTLHTKNKIITLFDLFEQEALMPAFYFSTDTIAKQLKFSPPSLKKIFNSIKSKSFHITKTQFNLTGFKTTAPKEIVYETYKNLI